ncbi:hypothetical protein [Actinomadura madurae]|nr:hypothetical protein [Actinomadura madurae]
MPGVPQSGHGLAPGEDCGPAASPEDGPPEEAAPMRSPQMSQ